MFPFKVYFSNLNNAGNLLWQSGPRSKIQATKGRSTHGILSSVSVKYSNTQLIKCGSTSLLNLWNGKHLITIIYQEAKSSLL